MKYTFLWAIALLAVNAIPAIAATPVSPCASFSTFDQLVAAGSCTMGPNNNVTFSQFHTNVSTELQKKIGVTLVGRPFNDDGTLGLYGFVFFTNTLTTSTVSFFFQAHCDTTCRFNDTFDRVQGNGGYGEFIIAGQYFSFIDTKAFQPSFPWTYDVSNYAIYTVTAVNNMAASFYEMQVNIVPGSWTDPGGNNACVVSQ